MMNNSIKTKQNKENHLKKNKTEKMVFILPTKNKTIKKQKYQQLEKPSENKNKIQKNKIIHNRIDLNKFTHCSYSH